MALPNDDIDEMYKTREVLDAQAHIWNYTFNFINSVSLKCAIQLGIPDIIHSHGQAMTLPDFVDALSINNNKAKLQDCIYRLMRILVHAGLFIQEKEGYLLTPTSRLLLKDVPNLSMIHYIHAMFDPIMMDPWHCLSQWIQSYGDQPTPFAITHGRPLFEYTREDTGFSCLFNEAMAHNNPLISSVVIEHCNGALQGLKSLVDVGGGT
ncbi:Trans-resveratrol di-O-methyltransferase [Capsicum baccatum]|uniref:Trans-resveratrol di-O-methyltransferase n=1 Tax=Capsicum baccatum TaxID=33114 RepID=A0A2G2UWX0_CAPBA|nr:Trans-resveratrol di-O-methyltransferase [Capsicum baccatum]